MTTADAGPLRGQAYPILLERIKSSTYPAGTVLKEVPLAADLRMSRTPVREALLRLERDGLVERTTKGIRVRNRTVDQIAGIYEACLILEPEATALAALRRKQTDVLTMEACIRAATEAVKEGLEPGRFLDQWHRAVWSAAHNEALDEVLQRLSDQLALLPGRATTTAHRRRSIAVHREITDAIDRQDSEGARSAMRDHLEAGRDAAIAQLLLDRAGGPSRA